MYVVAVNIHKTHYGTMYFLFLDSSRILCDEILIMIDLDAVPDLPNIIAFSSLHY
jgi:hypothetical protein